MKKRGVQKTRIGQVISDKMDSTVVVEIIRRVKHPRFKKYYDRRTKFYAHDDKLKAGMGDWVKIKETAPISKIKRWKVIELLKKSEVELTQK